MEINRNSWHYRMLNKYWWRYPPVITYTVCSYWTTVICVMLALLLVVPLILASVFVLYCAFFHLGADTYQKMFSSDLSDSMWSYVGYPAFGIFITIAFFMAVGGALMAIIKVFKHFIIKPLKTLSRKFTCTRVTFKD